MLVDTYTPGRTTWDFLGGWWDGLDMEEEMKEIEVDFISPCEEGLINARGRWSWVYAHREAENLVQSKQPVDIEQQEAPDMITSHSDICAEDLETGVYSCTLYRIPATLYFWRHGEGNRDLHGLVVLDSDVEGHKNARMKFEERRMFL